MRDRLIAAKERNRRAEIAAQLHGLADRVRFLYAAGPAATDAARKLEASPGGDLARPRADRPATGGGGGRAGTARLRTDLLDLAILWADLRVELAGEAMRPEAHREALRTLAEAEADWGPSVVLTQERRFHAEAIGGRDDAAPQADGMAPRTAWECYAMGRALLRHGDLESAAKALDRAVAMQPQSLWAQFYRGRCALLRHHHAEAVDAFGACVALAPEAVCYYNRTLAYAGLGAEGRARLDLERARELDPGLFASAPCPPAPASSGPGRVDRAGASRPIPTQLTVPAGLPDLRGVDIERGQPAASVAAGVDALDVPQVQDLPVPLRRVADDDGLARSVRPGDRVAQRFPAQRRERLLRDREVGIVVRVEEDVRGGLDVVEAPLHEPDVFRGDPAESRPAPYDLRVAAPPMLVHQWIGSRPARTSSSSSSWLPIRRSNRQRRPRSMSISMTPAAIRPPVDVVPQHHEEILGAWGRWRGPGPRGPENSRGCLRWRWSGVARA